jgi:hypothetical protein
MSLLADLDAFLQEHRRCGDLDSAVAGDRVWMTCSCGAVINRTVTRTGFMQECQVTALC